MMDIQKRLAATVDELRTAISDRDRRIAELEAASTQIPDLKAENEDLRNEVDALEEEGCHADDVIRKLEADLSASRAECKGLRAALEPFAHPTIRQVLAALRHRLSEADKYHTDMLFAMQEEDQPDDYAGHAKLMLSDFENARAALSQKETGA